MDKHKNRLPNFELLRIVLMLLIIGGHIAIWSGKLQEKGTIESTVLNFYRCFTPVGVNAFVIITGYFGTSFNLSKLFRIDLKVCFYTWLSFLVAIYLGIHSLNPIKDVLFLFPVLTKKYWFITVYFVLCICSPFINVFLEKGSQKILGNALIMGGCVFYLLATVCFMINAEQIITDAGYGIVNFIYLYCLGYYLRHYYEEKLNACHYLCIYFIACLGIFAVNMGMSKLMGFYFDSMISYNTMFTLIGSFGLFMCFKNLQIGDSKLIRWLGQHTLSVYLIHMCPFISTYVFKSLFNAINLSGITFTCVLVFLPLFIYFGATILDTMVGFVLTPLEKICIKKINPIANSFLNRGRII